eukprot:4680016-Amphidinium_carterae.1
MGCKVCCVVVQRCSFCTRKIKKNATNPNHLRPSLFTWCAKAGAKADEKVGSKVTSVRVFCIPKFPTSPKSQTTQRRSENVKEEVFRTNLKPQEA